MIKYTEGDNICDSNNCSKKIINLLRSIQSHLKCHLLADAKNYGLSISQFMVMYEVYHNEGISLNDLSTKLDIPKSSVSRLVDQLVNSEIIIREIPTENRRIVKLSMSPSFLQNKNITDMNVQFNDTISGKLDQEKAERIIFALEELNNIIDRDKK